MINRLVVLPRERSFFLFGPRQTGKTTLLGELWPAGRALRVELLRSEAFLKYAKEPQAFRREAAFYLSRGGARTVIVDEVQKVPLLLDEVQALLQEHPRSQFILTGSSPRKLRRGAANLLGGRLVQRYLHPFTAIELGGAFDLDAALRFGTLPAVHGLGEPEARDVLAAYSQTYLREEIQSEGLSRNLGGFSRFLDVAAAQCGELTSFSAVARDAGLPTRTVQSYYEVLEDTLVAVRLEAWRRSPRKRLTAHPKFYLFDTGVTNAVNRRLAEPPDPAARGRLFEQWVVLETHRLLSYSDPECRLYYWRTSAGAEVDIVIERGGKVLAACEVKSSRSLSSADASGLRAFREDHPRAPLYIVTDGPGPFELSGALALPWTEYVDRMRSGKLF